MQQPRLSAETRARIEAQHSDAIRRILSAEATALGLMRSPVVAANARLTADIAIAPTDDAVQLRRVFNQSLLRESAQLQTDFTTATRLARVQARELATGQAELELGLIRAGMHALGSDEYVSEPVAVEASDEDAVESQAAGAAMVAAWSGGALAMFNRAQRAKDAPRDLAKRIKTTPQVIDGRIRRHAATQAIAAYNAQHALAFPALGAAATGIRSVAEDLKRLNAADARAVAEAAALGAWHAAKRDAPVAAIGIANAALIEAARAATKEIERGRTKEAARKAWNAAWITAVRQAKADAPELALDILEGGAEGAMDAAIARLESLRRETLRAPDRPSYLTGLQAQLEDVETEQGLPFGWTSLTYDVWSAVLDRKTCPYCWQRDGRMTPIARRHELDWPIAHPFCRCVRVTVFVPEAARRKLPGIQIDYGELKADVREYFRGSSLTKMKGRRHIQRYLQGAIKTTSPETLTRTLMEQRYLEEGRDRGALRPRKPWLELGRNLPKTK